MPVFLLLVAYLLVVSVSLHTFALIYQERHWRERRWTALVRFSLGVASLALASLLWREISLATTTAALPPTQVYMEHTRAVRAEP